MAVSEVRGTGVDERFCDRLAFPHAWRNLSSEQLVQRAARDHEAVLTNSGALSAQTGEHTGRSPQDKYLVQDEENADLVWWRPTNQPMSRATFNRLLGRVINHFDERTLYRQDLWVCADPRHRRRLTVVSERAWATLFARNLFLVPPAGEAEFPHTAADITVLHAPTLTADPERDETRTETVIAVDATQRIVLILGTGYAGEIKKSIFGLLQHLLPLEGVATMHCAANVGAAGDVALFFGLSGTGKTTLSTDPDRLLIGDDEHGWDERGIFNFEGGCYAKVIGLNEAAEPDIYAACSQPGTVLENVVVDPETGVPDFASDALTENSRAAFPISMITRSKADGRGGHPGQILFLTADAFGVLPPIARLSEEQALYHFWAGYTSKLAGTERGVETPESTFSACYGEPFLAMPPAVYADLLGERIRRHRSAVWLVNTGWTGGPFGVGERMALEVTRAIVSAAVSGALDEVPLRREPYFGLMVPTECPGVEPSVLDPISTWSNPAEYEATAQRLARDFAENMARFEGQIDPRIAGAGPREE